jgi:hypothetical protein
LRPSGARSSGVSYFGSKSCETRWDEVALDV